MPQRTPECVSFLTYGKPPNPFQKRKLNMTKKWQPWLLRTQGYVVRCMFIDSNKKQIFSISHPWVPAWSSLARFGAFFPFGMDAVSPRARVHGHGAPVRGPSFIDHASYSTKAMHMRVSHSFIQHVHSTPTQWRLSVADSLKLWSRTNIQPVPC